MSDELTKLREEVAYLRGKVDALEALVRRGVYDHERGGFPGQVPDPTLNGIWRPTPRVKDTFNLAF